MIEAQFMGGGLADGMRRALGRRLEARGLGPRRTPSTVVHETPELRLRAYGGGGPAVLLVPAPIKRAYIWDLLPTRSVVARLSEAGCCVYLLEWLDPRTDELGLADYADLLLAGCIKAIQADRGQARVFLAGHSLGGTFAAIFATVHPERAAGLILAGAPLDFDAAAHALVPLALAHAPPGTAGRRVLGADLTALTLAAAPFSVGAAAWIDRFLSLADAEDADTLARVERWALDEMAMPAALVGDIVQKLFRENALVQGTLVVGDRHVVPGRLSAPVLAISDPRCALAPPAAVEPYLRAASSTDVERLRYDGDVGVLLQHAGLLVGRSAHRRLWPRVGRWIRERGEERVAAR